jgi:hypothetical protein
MWYSKSLNYFEGLQVSRKEAPPLVYSPFFKTLYDETCPVGSLGRGTHYSVLRTTTWRDPFLQPLQKAQLLDFAVIWDEDHDTRVMLVVETLYFDGLLAPVRFIGERKGGLTVLVAIEKPGAFDLASYEEQVKDAVRRSVLNDWWRVKVLYWEVASAGARSVGGESSIISDASDAASEKVAVYLKNIDNLWCLGAKARPEQEHISDAPDDESLEAADVPSAQPCRTLTSDEISSSCRRWRGDDEKGPRRHNGPIPLSESPVDIELRWRESENSTTKLIGRYRLDLNELLSQGYIRHDPKPGHVRLQFVHDGDYIYIQHRAERLRVGAF